MSEKVYPTDNRVPHRVVVVTVTAELLDRHGTNIEMLRDWPGLNTAHVTALLSERRVIAVPTADPTDTVDGSLREASEAVLAQLGARPDDTPAEMRDE